MKKLVIIALIFILALSSVLLCSCDREDEVGFVKAVDTRIVDGKGNNIGLYGTNFGGWLVQEEWLCPTDVEGEFGQIDMMLELANRFGKDGMEELIDVYEDNWITEQDFINVKNLGFNCIRIPFTYLNLTDPVMLDEASGKYIRTPFEDLTVQEDGFKRLDWALEMCKKHELYAILDMHGAVGSQSGNDHTGDIAYPQGGQLWLENEVGEVCRQKTKEIWEAIAKRYKDNKQIAMYDLMNEPGIKDSNGNQATSDRTHEYFDVLYDSIRAIDQNHIICLEACWMPGNLPMPEKYGWENVVYQYHHYNWASAGIPNQTYYYGLVLMNYLAKQQNVPIFVGEFNVWGDSHPDKVNATDKNYTQTEEEAWDGVMELYCGMGWNFTTWNYKHAATGRSSWGLYNAKSDVETLKRQADYKNMTKDEIASIWALHNAENYVENTYLTACILPHLANFNTNGNDLRPLNELPDYKILRGEQSDEE